jgi:hypothetical protein
MRILGKLRANFALRRLPGPRVRSTKRRGTGQRGTVNHHSRGSRPQLTALFALLSPASGAQGQCAIPALTRFVPLNGGGLGLLSLASPVTSSADKKPASTKPRTGGKTSEDEPHAPTNLLLLVLIHMYAILSSCSSSPSKTALATVADHQDCQHAH